MLESLGEKDAAAGFHNALASGRWPVLLVVDMVQAYFEPTSPLYARVEDARDASATLVTAARTAQVPVIYTSVSYAAGGANGGVFFRKLPALRVFEPGSPLGAFADGIDPRPGELVIDKQYPSAFFGTSLAATLTAGGIDTLVICGLTTSGCVRASVVDAMCHGFIPGVVQAQSTRPICSTCRQNMPPWWGLARQKPISRRRTSGTSGCRSVSDEPISKLPKIHRARGQPG
jgi:maleamate amidohydrolase